MTRIMADEEQILHVDPEHKRLRLVVALSLLVGVFVAFFLIRWLLGGLPAYGTAVSCVGGLLLGLSGAYVLERVLKANWHSGRTLVVDHQGVAGQTADERPFRLPWHADVELLGWYIQFGQYRPGGREQRLPVSWQCIAIQLLLNEERLIVFTFAPSRIIDRWVKEQFSALQFAKLQPDEVMPRATRTRRVTPPVVEIPTAALIGENGRYWLAEKRRLEIGQEVSPRDFETFMTYVQAHQTENSG